MKISKLRVALATAAGLVLGATSLSAATIDLGFAIDESGSVNNTELGLVRQGLAAALDLIPSDGAPGNDNTYRVSIVRFASGSSTLVEPTIITDASRAAIQNTLLTAPRISGGTNIPSAVTQLTAELCPGGTCSADTTLFNIATDGLGGNPTISANPAAIAAGVDGISYEAIGGGLSPAGILNFAYPTPAVLVTDLNNIPDPVGNGFVIPVSTFEDFEGAIAAKVRRIVTPGPSPSPVPLPAGLPLLLTGMMAFGGIRAVRRRKSAAAA